MIRNILVCTDGSPYGDAACAHALRLAGGFGARLSALHVLDIRLLEGPLMADFAGGVGAAKYMAGVSQFRQLLQEKGNAVAEAFRERSREAGREADCAVVTGHPVHAILEAEAATELLVLGQRGEHEVFGREMIGSTVERVVRRALKPCLVTPAQDRAIASCLAAFDGSDLASKALVLAAECAAALKLPLTVFTAADRMSVEEARAVAGEGRDMARMHGCEARAEVREGVAREAVLESAKAHPSPLIVMGAHGRRTFRELFVGCTAFHVVANAVTPVLLTR